MSSPTPPRKSPASSAVRAPGLGRIALELRVPLEFAASVAAAPWLASAPRGDGHGVIVYPGFMGSDLSTAPMRRLLRWLGHDVHGWEQGRNLGPQPEVMDEALARIRALAARHGRPVSLVGWSLGGVYARELAKLAPDAVRQIISMGSPFVMHSGDGSGSDTGRDSDEPIGDPAAATNAKRLFDYVNRGKPRMTPTRDAMRQPPPLPTTSIYSRSDGIVAWQCSIEISSPLTENIEVPASHVGLGVNPWALYALADRLAQKQGQWRPFERTGLRRWWFRKPEASAPGSTAAQAAPPAAPPTAPPTAPASPTPGAPKTPSR